MLPRLAVFVSMGELNQNTTLARLGYPDRLLFRLHRDMPRLRIVLIGSPANRYSSDRDVVSCPEGAFTWKALGVDARFDWIEIGGEGYTHSPPGDTNLNHHEFATDQTGCNLDHARMAAPEYCRERLALARRTYDRLGIPQNRIVLIRFPGLKDSPAALSAASEAGFLAVLGNRHPGEAGRAQWLAHPGGEILDLENTKLNELMPSGEDGPGSAMDRIDRIVSDGGILNLRAEMQDLFREDGEPAPAYRFLEGLVQEMDRKYGPEVWYASGNDLATWMDLRRHARVEIETNNDLIEVRLAPPDAWVAAGRTLDTAATAVRVPDGWRSVSGVFIGDGDAPLTEIPSWRWFWVGPHRLVIPFAVRGPVRLRVTGG